MLSESRDELGGSVISNVKDETSQDPALRNLRLSIAPGEKVVICGRTGR
jgi:ABC-type multidrug transport system fused ATPase/permease subunit